MEHFTATGVFFLLIHPQQKLEFSDTARLDEFFDHTGITLSRKGALKHLFTTFICNRILQHASG